MVCPNCCITEGILRKTKTCTKCFIIQK
jgi:hypothetical protein